MWLNLTRSPVIVQYCPAETLCPCFGRQTRATALFRVAGRSNSSKAGRVKNDMMLKKNFVKNMMPKKNFVSTNCRSNLWHELTNNLPIVFYPFTSIGLKTDTVFISAVVFLYCVKVPIHQALKIIKCAPYVNRSNCVINPSWTIVEQKTKLRCL